ncbi:DUF535 family protein [Sphingomonas sp. BIUV-7]|uniref:DUF535 family protein n=1 Tax=Sphingomonas natans TaxID=3063330 RepID=A0ABT8YD29_9SPHN|nr:DUF535 family protein [Sphingomonas sp. BIUV-7]MDO6416266.1 DUF535 family protein [Sphingomonas sp. BIUV-7]
MPAVNWRSLPSVPGGSRTFSRRLGQLLLALRRPISHLTLRGLLNRAKMADLAADERRIYWKYVGNYFDVEMRGDERRQIIEDHYEFILRHFPKNTLNIQPPDGEIFWTNQAANGSTYTMALMAAYRSPMEGELELVFREDANDLASIAFLFSRGSRVDMAHSEVVLIGGLQGAFGRSAEYRRATKENDNTTPIAMLIVAIRALASAMGRIPLVGVSNKKHIATLYAGGSKTFDYDRAWQDFDARRLASGYFSLDAYEQSQRSLTHLTSSHKARARRRMAVKRRLYESICESFEALLNANRAGNAVSL